MDQARRELSNVGRHSPVRLVVLTPAAQIAGPQPPKRAVGAVTRGSSATALLYALLRLTAFRHPPPTSFVPLPRRTWAGPGECECCGAYIPKLQRCGQYGSTSRLPRPRVPFSHRT